MEWRRFLESRWTRIDHRSRHCRAGHVPRPTPHGVVARDNFVEKRDGQGMEQNDWNSPTTKLLTLLNVSATKTLKRKSLDHQGSPSQKLNKRRALDHISPNSTVEATPDVEITVHEIEVGREDGPSDVAADGAVDLSDTEGMSHFLSRRSVTGLSNWTMKKSLRTSSTLELPRHF
jgi:hypothetical protein